MEERVPWKGLPLQLREEFVARFGLMVRWSEVEYGLNCSAAMVVTTSRSKVFLKAVRFSNAAQVTGSEFERALAPLVSQRRVGPPLLARFVVGQWVALVFSYVDGWHADLGPGSLDLDPVSRVLRTMGGILTPRSVHLPGLWERYSRFATERERGLLVGNSLLHTDTNPLNILVTDRGRENTAYVVDWAMPARGPAWVDVANTAVRLMEAGHNAREAQAWMEEFPSWRQAEPSAVDAFIRVVCCHRDHAMGEQAAWKGNLRFRSLVE
ncbi:phosphotransferase family protein [Streptomyces sp. SCSIO ZS0520]|uniref:phosphotransferase family protein n=1 Tax=Streptomyces sp. SCSIO ZS0520 TaxID=2892996 RepID=UPI0021D9CE19|nr:phosphotransferase [Streptomyces sp. SCSIO ZS0520]